MSQVRRVAVIGAGASGLAALKCCLDEELDPICFERMDYISGLWHYTEGIEDGQACVMKATIINSSKEMMCFSDFPIPKEYPMFMHNTYVDKYFHQYADKFDFKKRIRLKTEVLKLSKAEDFNTSGQWKLKVREKTNDKTEELIFDYVMVCTGHHAKKYVPEFAGISDFHGKVIHTHEYKHPRGYEDKRVMVIGIGNSGVDTVVDLTNAASKVFLSTRRGSWIVSRMVDNGAPADMTFGTRFGLYIGEKFPNFVNSMGEKSCNKRFNHKEFALQPKHPFIGAHPTVNDFLPMKIASGAVAIKPDVKSFTKDGVYFEDDTYEEIDAIVLATGYEIGFLFIDKSVIDVQRNKLDLYRLMFLPGLEKQTLAFIGCVQPIGATIPISEMQSRLSARVFKGKVVLPEKDEMWKEIKRRQEEIGRHFVHSQRHTIQVNYIKYMDELADMIGCKPNLKTMLFTDPGLATTCYFGPCTSYQYRLTGPGTWSGARESIMTEWDRTFYSLHTRTVSVDEQKTGSIKTKLFMFGVLVVAFACLYKYWY